METLRRFPKKKCLLPCFDVKTGIKTTQTHFLAFKSNHPFKIHGFGMYGPMTEKELNIQYGLLIDDFCNPGNKKIILSNNSKLIQFDGHRKIVPLLFHEPIIVRRYESYILFLNTDGYKTYRGVNGLSNARVGNLKLMFSPDFDGISETTLAEGNFPEIYFDRVCAEKAEETTSSLWVSHLGNCTQLLL